MHSLNLRKTIDLSPLPTMKQLQVDWKQSDPGVTRHLINEYLPMEEFIGAHWLLAYDFTDGTKLEDLYSALKFIPSVSGRQWFALFTVATHQMEIIDDDDEWELNGRISFAMEYLRDPMENLEAPEEEATMLAQSTHFLLDPDGFVTMQSSIGRIGTSHFDFVTFV